MYILEGCKSGPEGAFSLGKRPTGWVLYVVETFCYWNQPRRIEKSGHRVQVVGDRTALHMPDSFEIF